MIELAKTVDGEQNKRIATSELNERLRTDIEVFPPRSRSGKEIKVNYEVRDLEVAGVIRPQDISSGNTISYDQIAEARISYAGRGQITDVQQPRYADQIFDILFPF